jgi:hypothetical protein
MEANILHTRPEEPSSRAESEHTLIEQQHVHKEVVECSTIPTARRRMERKNLVKHENPSKCLCGFFVGECHCNFIFSMENNN